MSEHRVLPGQSAHGRIAAAGIATTAAFPVVVITLNVVQGKSYHPGSQAISELALGAGGGWMVVAFLGLGCGLAVTGEMVRRTSTTMSGRWLLPALFYVAAIPAGPMSAFFHTDRSGATRTAHGRIHDSAGIIAFVSVLVALYVASYVFGREPSWRPFARTTRAWALVATGAFVSIPLMPDHFGLGQRLYVGTFVSWMLLIAWRGLRSGEPAAEVSPSRRSTAAVAP
jgi:hypothetical protein